LPFHGDPGVRLQHEAIKSGMLAIAGVSAATYSNRIPGSRNLNGGIAIENLDGEMQSVIMYHYVVDHDFLSTYAVEMASGRAFSRDISTDEQAVILNQAAVEHLGYSSVADAVGRRSDGRDSGRVGGVIEYFHVESLRNAVHPMVVYLGPASSNYLTLRLASGNLPATLAAIESEWAQTVPQLPFS
jgi:putative ABC transport system permease protein